MHNPKQYITIKTNPELKDIAFKTKGILFDEELLLLRKKYLEAQKIYDTKKIGIMNLRNAKEKYLEALDMRPNEPAKDIPIGKTEEENIVIRYRGKPREFKFPMKSHKEIGLDLGMMDLDTSAAMSGSGFVTLIDQIARLERILTGFMIRNATSKGHIEVSPPILVREMAMYRAGQLPKFAKESYITTEHRLIPTSEVPLVNMVAGEIFLESQLPIRYTACTPCFRKEAGRHGKSTSGLMRVHQFNKVELVSITTQEKSEEELERITEIAESILEILELPYRRVLLCTGETGFSAAKTYDLEVWMPSHNTYVEISSCSNCTDFQAKRMHTKYKLSENSKEKKPVHTLNGSALAVGRLIMAILENYQTENGNVIIPDALEQYFCRKLLKA